MQKQDKEELPYHPTFDQFLKQHPPGRENEDGLDYYSTNEILAICHDIAYDEFLNEQTLLALLTGHQYDLINFGGSIQKWRIK